VDVEQALAFVQQHGIVLEAARGPVPSLVEAIVGEPVRGNWWAHPRGREIFQLTRTVRDADAVLVCRLVDGKVTLVHARLWPALARCAHRFQPAQLARLREEHTAAGRHRVHAAPFPDWVPAAVLDQAAGLGEGVAQALLQATGLPDFSQTAPSSRQSPDSGCG